MCTAERVSSNWRASVNHDLRRPAARKRDTHGVVALHSSIVSPLGVGEDALLRALLADDRAAATVTRFDTSQLPVDTAAEVGGDLGPLTSTWEDAAVEVARFDRKLELVLACASAELDRLTAMMDPAPPERRGIALGVGLDVSPLEKVAKAVARMGAIAGDARSLGALNPLAEGMGLMFNPTDLGTILLAERFQCGAFQESILTACSSSSQAIGRGIDAIRRDEADVVLVGGMDSLLNLPAFAAFAKLGVIQPSRGDPSASCKPCDRRRRGTLLGEGAGLLLLGSAEYAKKCGFDSHVALTGYGSTLDGYHITAPDPTGAGMEAAMSWALQDAGLHPSEIDYVNLHGTGTRANDPVELHALDAVLGEAASEVMVSSTKDRHGHLIAAAGIMEAIVVLTCMTHDLVPQTVNLKDPLKETGVDLVRDRNRTARMGSCMSNSFAFGGINTSIVFQRIGG
jgi:3-oxoacyl-[acyl-carrier-protein] synthase II